MLEITGDDIKTLDDTDLRTLIGLLCEAELHVSGLPSAGVTWGGHQNAKDGGIDVRVEINTTLHVDGFIPRSHTGFQVKKPDMPRGAILVEMRPGNQLRQVIKDLADVKGAYIIVSSQGSTSDSALKDRRDAMRGAISDYENASQLQVDFYDREQIAGWVRTHPSLVLWVRNKIGRPIQGWTTYANWASCPGGTEEEYILDESVRLYNSTQSNLAGLSVIDGINEMRTILRRPGSSVRLVGLSGVGKTRLIQSLFDKRIGEKPLNPSQVFYSDINDSPLPDPRQLAEVLISLRKPLTLIIDNCPPELHRRLTSICSASGSLINVLTVEYDVRDDQPEETEVFRLEPASSELIEKLVLARFKHVTEVGARIIAEFSGGNARIAIALGKTVERGEDISRIRDEDLFKRLFEQRNHPDSKLQRVAEVCSLVYSFDARTKENEDTELRLLGSLISMNIPELYENISELQRRDLIQQRGYWKALLPHAVANRLADRALQNLPDSFITDTFINAGSERLLRSFSRRLGYLHNSQVAKRIVKAWLSEEGLLGNVMNLNEFGVSLLKNVAPVDPELTLSVLERLVWKEGAQRFFSRENSYYIVFTRLLKSIAYDPALFERAAQLLCRFALTERPEENNNSIRSLLKQLFYIYLSGTKASPEQRLNVINSLLESDTNEKKDLGLSLLSASLEAWHFSSLYDFEFGAYARDFGWSPQNREEIKYWYKTFLDYIKSLISSQNTRATEVMHLLSQKFRGLWTKARMYDDLEGIARLISTYHSWNEGWIAVKDTIKFDEAKMKECNFDRLKRLEGILRPISLIDRVRLYTLTRNRLYFIDVAEEDSEASDRYTKIHKITRSLGYEVGSQIEIFNELLPELLSCQNGIRIFDFGQGLVLGCSDPRYIWHIMLQSLREIPVPNRNYQLLRGFLNCLSESHGSLCDELLDEAVTDEILSAVFPLLQTSVEITERGFNRLNQALELERAPIWLYGNLANGRSIDSLTEDDFCELLYLILSKSGGNRVACGIFHMKIYNKKQEDLSVSTTSLGRQLVLEASFSQNLDSQMEYELADIIKCCFVGENAKEQMRAVAMKISQGLENSSIYPSSLDNILNTIALTHPFVFLDVFLGEEEGDANYRMARQLSQDVLSSPNSIGIIKDEDILKWCHINAEARFPVAASAIMPYIENEDNIKWTPLANELIKYCPDPVLVLNQLKHSFRPTSWSGSRANIMEAHLPLLLELQKNENPVVSQWAIKEEGLFRQEILSEREWELARERDDNERFEY